MSQDFRKIIVWQKGLTLNKEIYEVFSGCKDFDFKSQIQRASVSIVNNIAEGSSRKSDKSFKNYLITSLGSANEVLSMLILAQEINLLPEEKSKHLQTRTEEICKMLSSYIHKLKADG